MKPLHEIADVEGGSTPRRDVPEYWNGNIPWATPTDLSVPGAGIANISRTKDLITDKGLASCSAKYLPVGTVLYSSRATIGKIAVAAVPLTTNQGFANLVPHEGIDSRFLAYSLWFFTPQIETLAGSTTFREVSRGNFRRFKIPIPPLDEQRSIVRILDEAEALRQLRARADERMVEFIPALFNQMFGDPATNPKGWTTVALSSMWKTKPNNGIFRKNPEYEEQGALPVVWVEELFHDIVVNISGSRRLNPKQSEVTKYGLKKGDLLFCRSSLVRDGIGQIAYYGGEDDEALFECHIIRVSPDKSLIVPEFVTTYFRLPHGKEEIMNHSRTATMTTIGQEDIARLRLPLPPLALQRDFAARVAEARALQDQQARSRSRLEEGFQALLHRAFAGEL